MGTHGRGTPPSGLAALLVSTLALAGCERGCLQAWIAEHGPGGGAGRSAGPPPAADLGGSDCSAGLARCSAGHVETSIGGHVPHPCGAPKELPGACACAWQPAGSCVGSCVSEGLEVVATPDVAREQLCAAAEVVLRPATADDAAAVTICADEGVSCVEGVVRVCVGRGQPARLAGRCLGGCARGVSLDPGDVRTTDGAAAILCRRTKSEHQ